MLKGWRTLIFNVGIAVFGVLSMFDWTSVLADPRAASFIVTAIGFIGALLRTKTDTVVGEKD